MGAPRQSTTTTLMAPWHPLAYYGPKDAISIQKVANEALVEEDELRAMEQDAPILEVDFLEPTIRTCSNCGCVSFSQVLHDAFSSTNSISQEMLDSMAYIHLRMNS